MQITYNYTLRIDPNVLKGAISGTSNNGNTTEPAWILSGVYKFTDVNSSSPRLNTTFYMIKIDGPAGHTHSIYDLKLLGNPVIEGNLNSTVYNGTTTVTLKDGPVSKVPTQISLLDDSVILITVDGNLTNKHFGTTPIYGTQQLICAEVPDLCK
ncbi:hypothetical protein [Candidatus Nitrosocosmicus arcticus]|uniref:Uncharacterized protein n=1 Tax=Candidatus Nitrosocosmicus arcticus TaxID=2035267 RepID=A0A557SWI8_9ARCH|nr:hypothetical protein [Candidatus Nitrosocosmicus arcticus]TVP40977.1 hypothetical protein NARC_50158 [Candidatus Nitrosocosmicus arcticus]